ncbi:hypothetical protein E2C01_096102 [Portunus trituberculatus]|uniref:Uncharacterized protein n=1 Tax=Portunus trituberculatus TaxID=210409 RepID=A0A5B7K617_PORTR|nr:hypothetical protein [Portunus trituberculatus]
MEGLLRRRDPILPCRNIQEPRQQVQRRRGEGISGVWWAGRGDGGRL